MYAIEGDIEVLRKSEYDYLWIPEDELNAASAAAEEELYAERVRFSEQSGRRISVTNQTLISITL